MLVFRALLACCLSLCLSLRSGSFSGPFRSSSRLLFRRPKVVAARLPQVDAREAKRHLWLRAANNGIKTTDLHLQSERSLLDNWTVKKAEQLEDAASITEVFQLYTQLLQETCSGPVDPVCLIAYQSTIRRVAYQVVKFRPKGSSETDLMDSVTDVHLIAVERLLGRNIDSESRDIQNNWDDSTNEGSNDRYCIGLAANNMMQLFNVLPFVICRPDSNQDQATSSYQFAGLAHFMYSQLSSQLGSSQGISPHIQDIQENKWMSPVLARLQRRCPSFVASEAEEHIAAIYSQGFEDMINNLKLELPHKLRLPMQSNHFPPISTNWTFLPESTPPSFPAWALACSIESTLRDSLQPEEIPKLEQRVGNALRQSLATRMHTHVKAIAALARSEDTHVVSPEQKKAVEHYLNLAHESVAAVFTLWQVRHNLVGVPDGDGGHRKEYLQPVELPSSSDSNATALSPSGQADVTLRSVPPLLRYQVAYDVEQLAERLQPSALLTATALLASAVRYSAGEEFRALSTYTSAGDPDELAIDRDALYFVVLAEVLANTLTAERFDEHMLYQNLLACAALEETLGVREPRAACRRAYEIALRAAAMRLRQLIHASRWPSTDPSEEVSTEVMHFIADVRERLHVISTSLSMILRLPEGEDHEIRLEVFTDVIEELLKEGDERGRKNNMRDVKRDVPWMSLLLSIDSSVADHLILPLGQMKFDKLVGDLLLNADVAVSMPELGASFVKQVMTVAESLLISPAQAEARVGTLAGAVVSSLLQRCLDAHQKTSFTHVDAMLTKAFYIYEHPLVKSLQANSNQDLKETGLLMAITQVGEGGLMDLIRMVEGARSRHSSNQSGRAPAVSDQSNKFVIDLYFARVFSLISVSNLCSCRLGKYRDC